MRISGIYCADLYILCCFPASKQASVTHANNSVSQQCQTSGKDSQHRFRSVAELSLGSDRFSQMGTVDMVLFHTVSAVTPFLRWFYRRLTWFIFQDKVLKGLVARDTSASCSPPNVSGDFGDIKSASLGHCCSEVHVARGKVPLDLTLKTSLRVVSSYPVNRWGI